MPEDPVQSLLGGGSPTTSQDAKSAAQAIVDQWLTPPSNPSGVTGKATASPTGVGDLRKARGKASSGTSSKGAGAVNPSAKAAAQQSVQFLMSPQQQREQQPVAEPSPTEQVLGASLTNQIDTQSFQSQMPESVKRGLLQRTAQGTVPKFLQDPANWPEEYKRDLLNPDSLNAKMHVYDEGKYGMPTFGYVDDPDRGEYKKTAELGDKEGNIFNEAKKMDAKLSELGYKLTPEERHTLIGYMWLKNGMTKDTDPVKPGSGAEAAIAYMDHPISDIKTLVQQGQARRGAQSMTSGQPVAPQDTTALQNLGQGGLINPSEAVRLSGNRGDTGFVNLASGAVAGADPDQDFRRWVEGRGPMNVSKDQALADFNARFGVGSYEQKMGLTGPAATTKGLAMAGARNEDPSPGTDTDSLLAQSGTDPRSVEAMLLDLRPDLWNAPMVDWQQAAANALRTGGNPLLLAKAGADDLRSPNSALRSIFGDLGGMAQLAMSPVRTARALGLKQKQSELSSKGQVAEPVLDFIAQMVILHKLSIPVPRAAVANQILQALPQFASAIESSGGDVGKATEEVVTGMVKSFDPTVPFDQTKSIGERVSTGLNLALFGLGLTMKGIEASGKLQKKVPVKTGTGLDPREWNALPKPVMDEATRLRAQIHDSLVQANGHATESAPPELSTVLAQQAHDVTSVLVRAANHIEANGGESAHSILSKLTIGYDGELGGVTPEIKEAIAAVKPMTVPDVVRETYRGDPRLDPFSDDYDQDFDRRVQAAFRDQVGGDETSHPFEEGGAAFQVSTLADHLEERSQKEGWPMTQEEQDFLADLPDKTWKSEKGNREGVTERTVVIYHKNKKGQWMSNLTRGTLGTIYADGFTEYQRQIIEDYAQGHKGNDNTIYVPADVHKERVANRKSGMSNTGKPRGSRRLAEFVVQEGELSPKNQYPIGMLKDLAADMRRNIKARQSIDGMQEVADILGVSKDEAQTQLDKFLARGQEDQIFGDAESPDAGSNAGADPYASAERTKDAYIVVRNKAASFAPLIEHFGGHSLGDDYYAIKNDSHAKMLVEQAGVEVDNKRTSDYNKRYANQSGLFGEEQAVKEPAPVEPKQESLFSKGTERTADGGTVTDRASFELDPKTGQGLIKLGPKATVAEVAHETAHYLETTLPPELLKQVSDALGFKGEWNVQNKERFARAFEFYLTEKKSVPGADPVMARLGQAVRDVYAGRQGDLAWQAEPHIGEGKLEVPDALRSIFDDMTKHPETWPGMTAAKVTQDGDTTKVETETGSVEIRPARGKDAAEVNRIAKESVSKPTTTPDALGVDGGKPVEPSSMTDAELVAAIKPIAPNDRPGNPLWAEYESRRNGIRSKNQEPTVTTAPDTFTESMSPMNAKKAGDALDKNVMNGGRAISRRALVQEFVNDGATVQTINGERRLVKPDGGYVSESQISKTGMDYAKTITPTTPDSGVTEHDPFADIPDAAPLHPRYAPVVEDLKGKGMSDAEATKVTNGIFGDNAARRALLDDPALIEKAGLPTSEPGVVNTWLDAMKQQLERKHGLKDTPAAEPEGDVSKMRGVEPKRTPRGKPMKSQERTATDEENRIGPGFRLKSLDVIGEKMNGPMQPKDFLQMLRNNGVKETEINDLDIGGSAYLLAEAKGKVTPESIVAKIKENAPTVYSERRLTTLLSDSSASPEERAQVADLRSKIADTYDQLKKSGGTSSLMKAARQYLENRGVFDLRGQELKLRQKVTDIIHQEYDDFGYDSRHQAYADIERDMHFAGKSAEESLRDFDYKHGMEGTSVPQDLVDAINEHFEFEKKNGTLLSMLDREGNVNKFAVERLFPQSSAEIERLTRQAERLGRSETNITGKYKPVWGDHKLKVIGGDNYREIVVSSPYAGFSAVGAHFSDIGNNFHIRATDRFVDGKYTTFIEELQSDVHQAARKTGGYQNEPGKPTDFATEGKPKYTPFGKTWEEVGFKRSIFDALDRGNDQVAWTAGKVHADRYKEAEGGGPNGWNEAGGAPVSGEESPAQRNQRRARGFQAAYDERLVNIANSIGKKYGVRAEQTMVEGEPAWKMQIPDALKLDYIEKGPTLFSGERKIPGLSEEKLPPDIQDVLNEAKDDPSWRGAARDMRTHAKNLPGAGAHAFSGIVSELRHYGESGKKAAVKIYNAWAFGRYRSSNWRHQLLDSSNDIYGVSKIAQTLGIKTHAAEIADTARAVLTRWNPVERDKVLAMDPGSFDEWINLAKEPKAMLDKDGKPVGPPPTLNQLKLWATWGRLAQETSDTAWSHGIGVVRTIDGELPKYEERMRGKDVQYIVGGGSADKAGVLETGTWLGYDKEQQVGLVLTDGAVRRLNPGDMFITRPIIDGMDFFPRKLRDSVFQALQDPESPIYAQAIAAKMKSGMSKEAAQRSIEAAINGQTIQVPGRSITRIERPRIPTDFPPDFYDWDFRRVTENHLDAVAKRTAQAQFMGRDMSEVAADFAEAAKGDKEKIRDWADSVQTAFGHGKSPGPKGEAARKAIAAYGGAKVIALLTTGKTAVKQIGSNALSAMVHGVWPTTHGLISTLNPEWWMTMERLGVLDEDYARLHSFDTEGTGKKVANAMLKWSLVTGLDKMGRVSAADAGIVGVKAAVNQLSALPDERLNSRNANFRYLSDWHKYSDEEIGKMVAAARGNGGKFNFTLENMEPMHTKAAFGGVQTQGIADPINYPSYITKNPLLKGLMTLNNFTYLTTKVVGYGLNEAGHGNLVPLVRMAVAGTLIGNVVMAGVSELEKHKQMVFWHQWFKLHDGMTDEQAHKAALDATGARADQPGFHRISDVKLDDTDLGQIASVVQDGMSASGVLGFYNGFVEQLTPNDDPYTQTVYDRKDRIIAGMAPAPLSDAAGAFAAVGAEMDNARKQQDNELKTGKRPKDPVNVLKAIGTDLAKQAGIPVIGGGVLRKPQGWKVALDELDDNAGALARKFSVCPNVKPWKGEDTDQFLARVRAQAVDWNRQLNSLLKVGPNGDRYKGEELRQRVLRITGNVFRKPRGKS